MRLVRSLLGIQTTSGLAIQVNEQHETVVRLAAADVAKDCRWVTTLLRTTIHVGAQQNLVDYPPNTGPGCVLAMAVYNPNTNNSDNDNSRYIPLTQAIIPIMFDTDQELAAGGATLDKICSRPTHFEQRQQIALHPRTDQPYQIRVEAQQFLDLPLAGSMSIVDAMLIVYKAASMLSKQMEDDAGAAYYAGLYADRYGDLKAWQSAGTDVILSTQADFNEDEANRLEIHRPNWDQSPTVR